MNKKIIISIVTILILVIAGFGISFVINKDNDVVIASNNMEEVSSIEETMTEETTSIEPTLIEEASTIEESTVVEETTITETIVEETTEVESTVVEEKPYTIDENGNLHISEELQQQILALPYFQNCTENELVEYFNEIGTGLLNNLKALAQMTNKFAEKGMSLHVPTEAEQQAAQEQTQQQPQQSQPTTTTPAPAEPQPQPQQPAETPAPAQPESDIAENLVPNPAGEWISSSDKVGDKTADDISVPEGIVVY